MATVNLFSVISSNQDQFRPPRKSKEGARTRAGRRVGERESLAEGPRHRFRGLQGIRVKNRGPSGRSGEAA
jgi:hypothetical protein